MYDLKRTWCQKVLTRPLAAGVIIEQEGLILCSVLQDGVEKLDLVAAPAGAEVAAGFSRTADSLPGRTSSVEEITVPASGTLIVSLRNNNLVAGFVRALVIATNTALTPDYVFAGATAPGAVKIDAAAGQLKFNVANAGQAIRVTYLYDLTINQAKQKFGERFINNRDLHSSFGIIEIGCGDMELYTDQFDASADWAGAGAIQLGPNGTLCKSGAGPALNLQVVQVPSIDIPVLGVKGNMGFLG